ncbi:MAG: DUF3268 family zinc-finger domain-containing protein [Tannerellaceae bacterium]|jgi:hypothetical protein|nr:DUF3268 family zinc-finger domain-containing protein [Tannerellaceae bacterium]
MNEAPNPDVCPYCGGKVELVDSSEIYGRSYGLMYLCKPCEAYVGVHKGTDKALGTLANKELRDARKQAHYHFDVIAKTSLINEIWGKYIPGLSNRNKAYLWLSMQLGVEPDECHIALFDIDTCKKVVEISKKAYKK